MTTETTDRVWTESDIKEVEVKITSNLSDAADMIILGIEEKFYAIMGDATGAAWVTRLLSGTGFAFSRKKQGEERSARDAMIVALLKNGATTTTISQALGIGLGTVHSVKKSEGLESVGGSKPGSGRRSEPTTAGAESASEPATPVVRVAPNPIQSVLTAVDRIAALDDADTMLDQFAVAYAYLIEKSGYTARQLKERATALAKAAKAIEA